MQPDQLLRFGPYRLNPHTGQLWQGKQEVKVTPKAAAVLRSLLERPGQVITKEELLTAAWPNTVVSDAALTTCIQELRQALHDPARKPRYIETMHRRGYRFIATVMAALVPPSTLKVQRAQSPLYNPQSAIHVVGREPELAQLHHWLAKAVSGERQLVFVTGEPGIGKTTLLEVFVAGVQDQEESQKSKFKTQKSKLSLPHSACRTPHSPISEVWVGRGQCIEHYGAGEAYLPMLEALGRLCRGSEGGQLIAMLRQHAPSWLVQMPSLLSPAELEELQRRTAGVTRERMLRELAEGLEVITAERLLVLVLEDLHWSDVSTLDLLSMLARRQERAHLLIIGTYRPVEVLTRDHPLKGIKQELQLHGQCAELALDFLNEAAVGEYLAVRFPVGTLHAAPLRSLGKLIHQRTDGNPLFMVNVTNELVARELITQRDGQWEIPDTLADNNIGVPENLRQLIGQQVARVNLDERRILEAASVAGTEFSAAAVTAGVQQSAETVETVEILCDGLVRREQFLRAQGTCEWPDGTITARYGFVHALYQEVVYEQISATRRSRLHRQIGDREEQGYGDRAKEIATELSVHFERGRDYQRAILYLLHAGENAVRRSAYQEAITLLTKGLELLKTLPDTLERIRQELTLQLALNDALIPVKGYIAPEVEKILNQARTLSQQIGEPHMIFPVLLRLYLFAFNHWEFHTPRELAEQMLQLAQSIQDRYFLFVAHICMGGVLYWRGELPAARTYFEQEIALYDPQPRPHSILHTADLRVDGLSYSASVLWYLGYPDQALKRIHEALTLAQELAHPYSLAYAFHWAGMVHQHRREGQATQKWAEAVIALAIEQGFPFWLAGGTRLRGCALVEQGQLQEGMPQMRQSQLPFALALLAEAYNKAGQAEEGLSVLTKALTAVEKTEERVYEAEMYRIKGELTLQQKSMEHGAKAVRSITVRSEEQNSEETAPRPLAPDPQGEAEACFLKAIEISRKQQAKSLELRAATSLARLWQQQGKQAAARKLLSEIYDWFTEGFNTKDLQEAKALLEDLGEMAKREKDKGKIKRRLFSMTQ